MADTRAVRVLCADGEFPRAAVDVLQSCRYFANLHGFGVDFNADVPIQFNGTLAMFRCVYESIAFGCVVTPCLNAAAILDYYCADMLERDRAAAAKESTDAAAGVVAAPSDIRVIAPAATVSADNAAEALFAQLNPLMPEHFRAFARRLPSFRAEVYHRNALGLVEFTVPERSSLGAMFACNVPHLWYGAPDHINTNAALDHYRVLPTGLFTYLDANGTKQFRDTFKPIKYSNFRAQTVAPGWVVLIYFHT